MSALLRTPAATLVVTPVDGPEIAIRDLRIGFDFVRTADQQPNAGQVTIYNLAERTRALISGAIRRPPLDLLAATASTLASPYKTGAEQTELPPVLARRYQYASVHVRAGFVPVLREVFAGTSDRNSSRPSGVDWLTTIECSDGGALLNHAIANRTFERGEPVFAAVQHLVRVLGLRSGNVTPATWAALDVFEGGGPLSGAQYFGAAYTPQGDPAAQLTQLLEVYRIRWILDDGAVYLLGPAGYLPGAPIDLGTPADWPEETEEGLLVRIPCNPLVRPGMRARLRSRVVDGTFFVQSVRHAGDTSAGIWSTVEVTTLGGIPGVF